MPQSNVILNPTQSQVTQAQQKASSMAEDLATSITGVDNESQALIRDMLPATDLESGADNGWGGSNDYWTQDGLAADTENETYNIDSNAKAQDKVYVFYGIANVDADQPTTEVTFDDGTDATFFRLNTEVLEVVEVSDYVLFDDPVVFGSTEDGDINQFADTASGDSLILLAKVAEPIGETLSTRQSAKERLSSRSR